MTNLYVTENLFASFGVEADVDTHMNYSKADDVEATPKSALAIASSKFKKGNCDETLTSYVPESSKKLGLEDLNATSHSTDNMDIDGPCTAVETKVDDGFVQPSSEKTYARKGVGPDVGTSLG